VIDRRAFVAGALALGAAPFAAAAQPAPKVYRIGFLGYFACSADPFLRGPFRQGLRELGYVEGHNIVIECRNAEGKAERNADLVAELVRLNMDVLVTTGTAMTLVAKQVTKTIPIVMVYVGDPVASGIVTSLARPEANVTGISIAAPEMVQKGLELLKEAVPSVSHVAVLIDSTNPGQTLPEERMTATAKALGVRLQGVELRTSADLDAALATVLKHRADALFVHPLAITPRDTERLAAFAVTNRLPTMASFQWYAKTGLLMSYVPDLAKQFRRVGIYIDKILRGANPTDLPIEQAERFELWINLKTAKALNLTIPLSLLLRADGWIE
jgi:ABC-type uncharacterized transport system substrate-binding protein